MPTLCMLKIYCSYTYSATPDLFLFAQNNAADLIYDFFEIHFSPKYTPL